MRSTVIWSFLSLVALATGGLISGCDSDAKLAKSAEGESCDKTADCNDGLRCRDQVCSKSSSGGSGSGDGGDGPGAGGGGSVTPPGPVLSTLGESCTKRADCEPELACFNQVCVETAGGGGEGGGELPEVRLGALGETCGVSADCEDGLSCTPGGYVYGPGTPIGFVGVCGYPSGSLPPTGKTCFAECTEPTDCCELPLEVHVANSVLAPWGAGAESCADLAVQLDGVDCAGVLTAANAAKCFAQAAYCECTARTWECTAGQCVYAAACGADGAAPDGCPHYTRAGRALGLATCNTEDACAPEPVDPTCTNDATCNGEIMADLGLVCETGECTCYQDSGLCYRRCDVTLDCRPGQVCDDDTNVCVPSATCTTDAQCAVRMGSPRYTCVEAACQLTCATDYDCNGGSFGAGINTLVCGPDKLCQPIGCSTDDDCSSGASNTGVRMFCTEPAAVAGVVVNSAITD